MILGIINFLRIVSLLNTVSFLKDQFLIRFLICLILQSKLDYIISFKFKVKFIPIILNWFKTHSSSEYGDRHILLPIQMALDLIHLIFRHEISA